MCLFTSTVRSSQYVHIGTLQNLLCHALRYLCQLRLSMRLTSTLIAYQIMTDTNY